MMNKLSFVILFILVWGGALNAQETWSLEKCITHGLQNSLPAQQAQNNVYLAELNAQQQKMSRLPTLNGSVNAGYQLGRTIDPTTNSFDNQAILTNSLSVSANATLWAGNSVNNSIKKGKLDLTVAQLNKEEINNTTALNISNAYLNILLAEERLENAENTYQQSQQQLEQTQKLIDAGVLPEANKWDLISKMSLDKQALVNAQNQVTLSYLTLRQLLRIPTSQAFQINRPEIVVPTDDVANITVEEVYLRALKVQPQIESANLSVQSTLLDQKMAKAGRLPRLSIFGSLSSNYSDIAADISNPDYSNVQTVLNPPLPVQINGVDGTIASYRNEGVVYPTIPYFDQLNTNFGQSIGLSLQVPIYNQHRNNINVQRSEVQMQQATLNSEQKHQTLRTDIENAVANAKAGKLAYDAASDALNATQIALDNTKRKFDLGAANSFELTTAQNNYDIAKNNVITAKYQYVFFLKVIDFYKGIGMKL